MHIAQVAPLTEAIPPRLYGGTERVVFWLTEELLRMGHEVTLFASGDSTTNAALEPCWPESPRLNPCQFDPMLPYAVMLQRLADRMGEFDVIHNSFDFLPLTYSDLVRTPVVTTIHGFSSPRIVAVYERYNRHGAYVAISDSDRHPRLDYAATIHHGIDTGAFGLHPSPGGYLLFFGRIHPDKGTAAAIEVAARVGLLFVGALNQCADQSASGGADVGRGRRRHQQARRGTNDRPSRDHCVSRGRRPWKRLTAEGPDVARANHPQPTPGAGHQGQHRLPLHLRAADDLQRRWHLHPGPGGRSPE